MVDQTVVHWESLLVVMTAAQRAVMKGQQMVDRMAGQWVDNLAASLAVP